MSIQNQTKRRLIHGGNALVLVLIVLGLAFAINFFANRYFYQIDLTKNNLFSVSKQSLNVVENLNQDIKVVAFFPEQFRSYEESKRMEFLRDLLGQYEAVSSRLNIEIINPNKEPALAKESGIRGAPAIIIQSEELQEILYGYTVNEQTITAAIVKVTRDKTYKIGFLSQIGGHELSKDLTVVRKLLMQEGYELEEVDFVKTKELNDYSAVIIPGATKTFNQNEKYLIDKYIYEGGKVLLALDPITNTGLEELALHYGVEIRNDFIIDEKSYMWDLFRGRFFHWPIITTFSDFQVVKDFKAILLPLARSLKISSSLSEEFKVEEFMKTTERSWNETSLESKEANFTEGEDLRGPLVTAVSLVGKFPSFYENKDLSKLSTNLEEDFEIKTDTISTVSAGMMERGDNKEARLIIFGDSDFMADTSMNQNYNNADLILNSINWLIEDEDLISIRPKEAEDRRIDPLSETMQNVVFWLNLFGIPSLVLIYGIIRYFIKKRSRKNHL